ncbi:hypothetical protein PR048_029388 [Dryococelus australis]|uniref:Uncharacterized protein n=1 Tax=Dryococelus australis TaxID=614101 RepID=A0ABQ9GD84_9NEOP|nr:hypothetical protein PR048_029388 [Dryococelus australis]
MSKVKIRLPPPLNPRPAILSGDRGADGCTGTEAPETSPDHIASPTEGRWVGDSTPAKLRCGQDLAGRPPATLSARARARIYPPLVRPLREAQLALSWGAILHLIPQTIWQGEYQQNNFVAAAKSEPRGVPIGILQYDISASCVDGGRRTNWQFGRRANTPVDETQTEDTALFTGARCRTHDARPTRVQIYLDTCTFSHRQPGDEVVQRGNSGRLPCSISNQTTAAAPLAQWATRKGQHVQTKLSLPARRFVLGLTSPSWAILRNPGTVSRLIRDYPTRRYKGVAEVGSSPRRCRRADAGNQRALSKGPATITARNNNNKLNPHLHMGPATTQHNGVRWRPARGSGAKGIEIFQFFYVEFYAGQSRDNIYNYESQCSASLNDPGTPWWEASSLTALSPRPPFSCIRAMSVGGRQLDQRDALPQFSRYRPPSVFLGCVSSDRNPKPVKLRLQFSAKPYNFEDRNKKHEPPLMGYHSMQPVARSSSTESNTDFVTGANIILLQEVRLIADADDNSSRNAPYTRHAAAIMNRAAWSTNKRTRTEISDLLEEAFRTLMNTWNAYCSLMLPGARPGKNEDKSRAASGRCRTRRKTYRSSRLADKLIFLHVSGRNIVVITTIRFPRTSWITENVLHGAYLKYKYHVRASEGRVIKRREFGVSCDLKRQLGDPGAARDETAAICESASASLCAVKSGTDLRDCGLDVRRNPSSLRATIVGLYVNQSVVNSEPCLGVAGQRARNTRASAPTICRDVARAHVSYTNKRYRIAVLPGEQPLVSPTPRPNFGRGYAGCRTTSLEQVQLLKRLHYFRMRRIAVHCPLVSFSRFRPRVRGMQNYFTRTSSAIEEVALLPNAQDCDFGRGYAGCRTTSLEQVQLLKRLHYFRTRRIAVHCPLVSFSRFRPRVHGMQNYFTRTSSAIEEVALLSNEFRSPSFLVQSEQFSHVVSNDFSSLLRSYWLLRSARLPGSSGGACDSADATLASGNPASRYGLETASPGAPSLTDCRWNATAAGWLPCLADLTTALARSTPQPACLPGRSPRKQAPTSGIVRHDSHMRKSGLTRPGIEPGSPWWGAIGLTAAPRRSYGILSGSNNPANDTDGDMTTAEWTSGSSDPKWGCSEFSGNSTLKWGRSGSMDRNIQSGDEVAQRLERSHVGTQWLSGWSTLERGRSGSPLLVITRQGEGECESWTKEKGGEGRTHNNDTRNILASLRLRGDRAHVTLHACARLAMARLVKKKNTPGRRYPVHLLRGPLRTVCGMHVLERNYSACPLSYFSSRDLARMRTADDGTAQWDGPPCARSRSEGAIGATLTRTPSASSLLRRKACSVSVTPRVICGHTPTRRKACTPQQCFLHVVTEGLLDVHANIARIASLLVCHKLAKIVPGGRGLAPSGDAALDVRASVALNVRSLLGPVASGRWPP